jgi:GGDEF domain-containing protein
MLMNHNFGLGRRIRKIGLEGLPDLRKLEDIFCDLANCPNGAQCDLRWQAGREIYTLSVTHSSISATADWKLYQGTNDNSSLMWEHQSNDVPLVYNLIISQIGAGDNCVPTEGLFSNVHGIIPTTDTKGGNYVTLNLSKNLQQLLLEVQGDAPADRKSDIQAAVPFRITAPNVEHNKVFDSVDLTAGREVLKHHLNDELGCFSYPAFLFALEREYYETVLSAGAMTVVLLKAFSVSYQNGIEQHHPLPPLALEELVRTIKSMQRKTDILARYESDHFILLLPGTNTNGGRTFARKIEKILLQKDLMPCFDSVTVKFAFGIASLPNNCKSLAALLGIAEQAITRASQSSVTNIVTDEDIFADTPNEQVGRFVKAVDLVPMRNLATELISNDHCIFTYPALLTFLEHEHNRANRNRRELYIMLLKIRMNEETFLEERNLLPRLASYEAIRRVTLLLKKRDILAHYRNGNFVIICPNNSLAQMHNLAERVQKVILQEEWLAPECHANAIRLRTQICSLRKNEAAPHVLGLSLAS